MGGSAFPYCTEGEILGSILSGSGDCFQAVTIRLAIGRGAFNNLYRVFKRKQIPLDLRFRFFESFVVGTLHGYQAWLFSGAVIKRLNGWSSRMLSVITGRTPAEEARHPTVAVSARLIAGQTKMIGGELRQSDSFSSRIALLRTLLLIRLGVQKKEDTLLGHVIEDMWGDHIPSAYDMITTAGGLYDQSPEATTRRELQKQHAAQVVLRTGPAELLKQRRAKKREKRNWGERARQLIASLPSGSYVLFTDGGSNDNREETGWGVVVLRKRANQHPEVVAELFGRVDTDYDSEYHIGAISPTNDTAEATAAYQANLWLWNEGSHVPAVIV
jgi:hypothetical protein